MCCGEVSCSGSNSDRVALGHSSGSVSLFVPSYSVVRRKRQQQLHASRQLNAFENPNPLAAQSSLAAADAVLSLFAASSDHCRGSVSIIALDS
jgi:hypothetical protein